MAGNAAISGAVGRRSVFITAGHGGTRSIRRPAGPCRAAVLTAAAAAGVVETKAVYRLRDGSSDGEVQAAAHLGWGTFLTDCTVPGYPAVRENCLVFPSAHRAECQLAGVYIGTVASRSSKSRARLLSCAHRINTVRYSLPLQHLFLARYLHRKARE